MAASGEFDAWFPAAAAVQAKRGAQAPRLRVLCFCSSGAQESMYTGKVRDANRKLGPNNLMTWAESTNVEVLAVQLPGRGRRHKEAMLGSLEELAETLLPVAQDRLLVDSVPYAVVGHSMGCWAAHDFLRLVQQRGLPMPKMFVVACFPAPIVANDPTRPWRANRALNDADFRTECLGWDINKAVFGAGIWENFEPLLRADFRLFDEYTYTPATPAVPEALGCPIVGYPAARDQKISPALMETWTGFTSGAYTAEPAVQGHHLFVLDDKLKQAWFTSLTAKLDTACSPAPEPTSPSAPAADAAAASPPPAPAPASALAAARAAQEASEGVMETKEGGGGAPRVLCLHGFGGSSEIFRRQTKPMATHCENRGGRLVLEFLDAPTPASWDPTSMMARLLLTFFPDCENLQWARRVARNDPSRSTISSGAVSEIVTSDGDQMYVDWDTGLASILAFIQANGPFDGVMGFSQGANMGVLLAALAERRVLPWLPPFQFGIFICGSEFGWAQDFPTAASLAGLPSLAGVPPKTELLRDAVLPSGPKLRTPSLHLVGKMDPIKADSFKLANLFAEETRRVEVHENGHKPPMQRATAGVVTDFVQASVART